MKLIVPAIAAALLAVTASCSKAYEHSNALHSSNEREMTVGIVQKEIRNGMSQGEVAVALGSPNIVSKDSEGKETWIYDKIATEASYSRDDGGLFLFLGVYDKSAGASAVTQKTLTVVIKFDDARNVEKCSYHSSKF